MRRYLVLASAATLAYCLVNAVANNGGEAASHTGAPTFSADIASAPIGGLIEQSRGTGAAVPASEASVPTAASLDGASSSAEKPAVRAAAMTVPPKVRAAAVSPHAVSRHAPKSNTIPPTPVVASAQVMPNSEPPMPPVMVAQRSAVASGCSAAKWSQPDAAGVPVMLCN
ncbi:MAG TPA: hypothetical protein VGP42_03510 [Stellaceae bacterium]|jgi:hypothetical protein|nr:hypothetical protein [Stellaceae bacterium]